MFFFKNDRFKQFNIFLNVEQIFIEKYMHIIFSQITNIILMEISVNTLFDIYNLTKLIGHYSFNLIYFF